MYYLLLNIPHAIKNQHNIFLLLESDQAETIITNCRHTHSYYYLFRLSHLHHIRYGGHGVTEGLEQPLDLGSLGRPLPLPEAGLLHALQRLAVTLGCQVVPLHALVLELQTEVREDFTITEMAPTRAFSWLKPPTSAFTIRTLY